MGQKSSRRRRDPWADSPPKPSRRQVYPTERTTKDNYSCSTQHTRSQPVIPSNQRATQVAKKPYQQPGYQNRQYPPKPTKPEITPSEAELEKLKFLKEIVKRAVVSGKVEIFDGEQKNSYDSLFSKYMGPELTAVRIVEPWLTKRHQLNNLTMLLECCVINAPSLRVVQVCTKPENKNKDFCKYMKEMRMEMNEREIVLVFEINALLTRYDRAIVLDTGYVLTLSMGLDIFRFDTPQQTFYLGQFDQRLRSCKSTRIDIDVFDV